MQTNLPIALALALSASAAGAQINRDVARFPLDRAGPSLVYLCPDVPSGTKAPFTSISGRIDAGQLVLTVRGKCFAQKPRNLSISASSTAQPPEVLPLASIIIIPLESWKPGSAVYRTVMLDTAQIEQAISMPAFSMSVSVGPRNYFAALTEAHIDMLQNGGTITNPPIR